MASRKSDPYLIDEERAPLTAEEIKRLRPAKEVFDGLGIPLPRGRGRPVAERGKQQVTLRLDRDVIEFFKSQGPGWQTRMNDELATVVRERRSSR